MFRPVDYKYVISFTLHLVFTIFSKLKHTSYFRQTFIDKREIQYIHIYIYIYKHLFVIFCLCVSVFQLNFNVVFQMHKFPHVAPPKSICTSLVLSFFYHPQNLMSRQIMKRLIVQKTHPPLPRLP